MTTPVPLVATTLSEVINERKASVKAYIAQIVTLQQQFPQSRFYLDHLKVYLEQAISISSSVVCIISKDGQLQTFKNALRTGAQFSEFISRPILILVEGFPPPEVIGYLGSTYEVRPEFFLGHLEIERAQTQVQTSFELPTLPSCKGNTIHIRMARLGQAVQTKTFAHSITDEQFMMDLSTSKYEKRLFDEKRFGATRFRKTSVHSRRYFSVEQEIAFCVTGTADSWTDSGASLLGEPNLPWSAFAPPYQQPTMLPSVAYNQIGETEEILDEAHLRRPPGFDLHSYHPLNDRIFTAEKDLLQKHPFFLLSRVFSATLVAWNQILNVVQKDYKLQQAANADQSMRAIEHLQAHINLVDHIKSYLETNKTTLEQQLWPEWSAKLDDDDGARMNKIRESQIQDHRYLIASCNQISHGCRAASQLLVALTGVAEARRSLEQAERVAQLTKLAFFFLPVTLVTSAFGMNAGEINDAKPPLWTFGVAAALSVVLGWLFLEHKRIVRSCLSRLRSQNTAARDKVIF